MLLLPFVGRSTMTDTISVSLETHTDNLKVLCRICGRKLKITKELYESSYAVVDFREWLLKNFGLNTEKDDSQIHPQRFCNLCYVSSGESGSDFRVTRQPIAWEAHSEDNCTACSTLRLLQKGGRPKKSKRGRPASQKRNLQVMRPSSPRSGSWPILSKKLWI